MSRGPRKRFCSRKNVQFTSEQDRAIETLAEAEALTAADVIRRAVSLYFKLNPQEGVQAAI